MAINDAREKKKPVPPPLLHRGFKRHDGIKKGGGEGEVEAEGLLRNAGSDPLRREEIGQTIDRAVTSGKSVVDQDAAHRSEPPPLLPAAGRLEGER